MGHDTSDQPFTTAVHNSRERLIDGCQHDRCAVGNANEDSNPGLISHQGIGDRYCAFVDVGRPHDVGAVHLSHSDESVNAHFRCDECNILLHELRVVAVGRPQVERRPWTIAHTAGPISEGELDSANLLTVREHSG